MKESEKIVLVFLVTVLCFSVLCSNAYASTADVTTPEKVVTPADITGKCKFTVSSNQKTFYKAVDEKLTTVWTIGKEKTQPFIRVEIPKETKDLEGFYVQWYTNLPKWSCFAVTDKGKELVKKGGEQFYAEFITIPQEFKNSRIFEIIIDPGQPLFSLAEIRIFTGGIPYYAPQWQSYTGQSVFALVIVCHPDDEVLYFGVLIAYAREHGLEVVVAFMNGENPRRRLEAQESVWSLGGKIYPVIRMKNPHPAKGSGVINGWSHAQNVEFAVELIRMVKPQYVFTHDINGEYGHASHKETFKAIMEAVNKAVDPSMYTKSAEKYGVWSPDEVYVHLWKYNPMPLIDINQPLASFQGMTPIAVAERAFLRHKSQQNGHHTIKKIVLKAGRLMNMAAFGLIQNS